MDPAFSFQNRNPPPSVKRTACPTNPSSRRLKSESNVGPGYFRMRSATSTRMNVVAVASTSTPPPISNAGNVSPPASTQARGGGKIAMHANPPGVAPIFRKPAAALANGRRRLRRGPTVAPNSPSTRLRLNAMPSGKSDGYHVSSASTPSTDDGCQVNRPPTPRSLPSNSLHFDEAKCALASKDCAVADTALTDTNTAITRIRSTNSRLDRQRPEWADETGVG